MSIDPTLADIAAQCNTNASDCQATAYQYSRWAATCDDEAAGLTGPARDAATRRAADHRRWAGTWLARAADWRALACLVEHADAASPAGREMLATAARQLADRLGRTDGR